ncbi:MAG: HAD family hydrolase [Bacillota bacterium]
MEVPLFIVFPIFGKPDPSIYHHAVNQLGVMPEEAWMVGDNFEWEVIAPQQIGIKGIWINPKGIDTASFHHIQPYQSINTINDLVKMLNGI